ncbi:TetR/AcrR family transcriptional regulator [Pseudonocardia sp. MH-G8]|uniref:TetR/AcrR family transcriptional regulator n=1 Tax=Pseudonocardia sp. MH-G8 TaxID=1854588 RepID=UPI000BA0F80A|nr:TetR/AcrR family transcriptional regulator [Pseudonocardia sp. MH-G8]OZM79453.1 TetR family transcriptional regulator [Pseudonocardia sp. MH-G8]
MTATRPVPATDTDVAARVRELLARDGWTQRRFAEAIGLEETKLSKSLAGRRRFPAAELVAIADAAGVTVNWLLHGRDDARTHTAVPRGAARTQSPGRRGAQARRRILEAAWNLIADRGYHRVRTADVAQACGTSPAAIHYHFPTRSGLLDEALRHNVKLAFDRQVAALGEVPDPHARLLRLIDLQLPSGLLLRREWSIWIQVWAETAIDPARRELYWDSYDRWYRSVLMTLADGADAGVFVPGRAESLARQLTALIDGLGIQVMAATPGTSPEEMRAVLHDFIDRAVLLRRRNTHPATEAG